MEASETARPLLRKTYLLDLLAFVLGVGVAYFLNWQVTDLVWSLWLSSLVVGYLTILCTIAGMLFWGKRAVDTSPQLAKHKKAGAAFGLGGGLFFLGFFSLHFCAFHAGHAMALTDFFPLPGVESKSFGAAFMNPIKLWAVALFQIVPLYGLFLLPVIISERKAILNAFSKPVKNVGTQVDGEKVPLKKGSPGKAFVAPYVNVIRMHILIFFFAGAQALNIDSFAVFTVVYAVYFFPWRMFRKREEKV